MSTSNKSAVSKKVRNPMFSSPTTFALITATLLCLPGVVKPVQAEQVLIPTRLDPWSSDCDKCELDAQYDVMQGDVLRLASHGGHVSLSRDIEHTPPSPQLSWQWSADRFADLGPLVCVTLHFRDTQDWPERTLHYLWDSSRSAGSTETLSDFEHVMIVTGREASAENWYAVSRNLTADWQAFYSDALAPLESVEISLNMPGQKTWGGAFINGLNLAENPQSPAPQTAVATDE